jgi:hypothetical protein
MAESFWQIPDVSTVRSPLSILREQAAALTEQTKGLLVGVVETRPNQHNADMLLISLEIYVPALAYQRKILTYDQPIEMYPGNIAGGDLVDSHVADEGQFLVKMKDILASKRTADILASLLIQAAA